MAAQGHRLIKRPVADKAVAAERSGESDRRRKYDAGFRRRLVLAGYSNQCGTKRLELRVMGVASSRMPMPAGTPATTQLPITG